MTDESHETQGGGGSLDGSDPDDADATSQEDGQDPAGGLDGGSNSEGSRSDGNESSGGTEGTPATESRPDRSEDDPTPSGPERDTDAGSTGPERDTDAGSAEDEDPTIQSPEDVPDASGGTGNQPGVPDDVAKYDRFKKMDGAQYDRVNEFLRDRTYITAREWAIARLCADFRTETGVEMTKIGENLPDLVPFMTDTYTPQAVNQARSAFDDKVRMAGATFLYGAMCDFYTAEELEDVMYEVTEVAKFLLEVEGVDLSVEDELEAEDRISSVMRAVRESSAELRYEECPECGHELGEE